jgi:hypothetical protein
MVSRLYPPSRPQLVGEVLDAGFQIFASTLYKSLPLGVVAVLAGQLVNIHDLIAGRPLRRFGGTDLEWWAWYLSGMVLMLLVWGTLWRRQATLAAGAASSTRAELRRTLAVLPTLIAQLLVAGAVLALIAAIAAGVIAVLPDPSRSFVVLGLLLPPGLYLTVVYVFAFPASLFASMSPVRALLYSAALIRGQWWRTILILIVLAIVIFVLYALVGAAAALALSVTGVPDVAVVTAVSAAAAMVMGAVSLPLLSAMLLATFGELRVRREGLDLEGRIERALES